MSSWTMPDWMKEIIGHLGYFYPDSEQLHGADHAETTVHKILEELRTAGLLLTPGERDIRDAAMMLDEGGAELTHLRAENERLRGGIERVRDEILSLTQPIDGPLSRLCSALTALLEGGE